MSRSLITAPTVEPISLVEAKEHLKDVPSDDDALIESLITVARQHCEFVTRRALNTQTWDLYCDGFPTVIEVPLPRLISVTSITYTDADGVSQTLATTEYTVDAIMEPGRIVEAYTKTWPTTRAVINSVIVRFVAGYGANPTDVPETIRQAILLLIGHWYANREATTGFAVSNVPMAADALLAPHRVVTTF